MTKTIELLKMMRGKIASGWTQGCSARSTAGYPVVPYSEAACEWCLIGSMTAEKLYLSYFDERVFATRIIRELIANRNEVPDLALYNDFDGRTRVDVLELLDEAIQVASVGGY